MDFDEIDETRFDWLLEARRRADELDDGSVQAVPGDEVMKTTWAMIK
ncbi:MAG TPA: addiction module protein [Alcanivorax sp.]|nr:addiction module protein [Alcanivorax sp.]